MIKRDIAQLAVYSIEQEEECLPYNNLSKLYLEKTSEIIYIARKGKLYGIVCMREALHCKNGSVQINKSFTALDGYDVTKAHEIFQRRGSVHKIPVVNEDGALLGDYSRWDDILYIRRKHEYFMHKEYVNSLLGSYKAVYVVEPVESKAREYLQLLYYLRESEIEYTILRKEEIDQKLEEQSICIFFTEDEKRGIQCLYGLKPALGSFSEDNICRTDMLADEHCKIRFATYKSLLLQIEQDLLMEKLGQGVKGERLCSRIDDKATVFLSALQEKGIQCFCLLYGNEKKEETEYWINFDNELSERLKSSPISLITPWSKGEEDKEFYNELYQQEDYKQGIAQKEIFNAVRSFEYKKNISGKYFNAQKGKRITCFQPKKYIGTIYLMGMCMIIGRHVEDQYTIGSYLQKNLLERGYNYRVENCGVISRVDAAIESRLEEIDKFNSNDIVIYQSNIGDVLNIPSISTRKIFEKYGVTVQWIMDIYGHFNHKVNKLVADSMFDLIEPYLVNNLEDNGGTVLADVHHIMRNYVKWKYLDRYFATFSCINFNTVGAIVMNGNPFHKGHRYLIEQARQQVECLIIFIIEEDRFLFPFEERFNMVKEGTRDIDNIIVVPNGEFVFSMNNFREYYIKREDDAAAIDALYDINEFVDYIAEPLHITHRFAGEETKRSIIKVYNETMKKVLGKKGINYVEIPKMSIEDEVISATKVRKYLKNHEYEKAFTFLPESTKQYLMHQMGMEKELR